MADSDNNFGLPEEPASQESFPWLVVGVAVVLFAVAAVWIFHSKEENKSREAVVAVMEKELDMQQAALQAQKDKVVQLSQQLEGLKSQIQYGQVKDRKKAVEEFNAMAKQQNAERDKYIQMANQYNEKVAKLHQLQ
jgi:hypothetical protein